MAGTNQSAGLGRTNQASGTNWYAFRAFSPKQPDVSTWNGAKNQGLPFPASFEGGSASLTFGQTGTATGAGELSGTAALTWGQTAALTGAGVLSGSSSMTLGVSATGSLVGALAGAAAISLAQSGTVTGAGALAGTSAAVFGQTGTVTGKGALAGTAAVTIGQTGTLTGKGALSGTAAAVLGQLASLGAKGALGGTSALLWGQTGDLQASASGSISGTTSLALAGTGTLLGKGSLLGSSALTLSASSTVSGKTALIGTSSVSFVAMASGSLTGFLTGRAGLYFAAGGTLSDPSLLHREAVALLDLYYRKNYIFSRTVSYEASLSEYAGNVLGGDVLYLEASGMVFVRGDNPRATGLPRALAIAAGSAGVSVAVSGPVPNVITQLGPGVVGMIRSDRTTGRLARAIPRPGDELVGWCDANGDATLHFGGMGALPIYRGDSCPTTGTWDRGTTVYNSSPESGGYIGWVCLVSGTPGTWATFGKIT